MNKYSLYFDDMQQVWDLYKGEFDNKEFVRSYKTKRNAMNRVKAIALKEEAVLTLFVGYKDKNGNVVNEDYSINGESATQLSKDTYSQEQVSALYCSHSAKEREEKTCVDEQEESASNQTDLSEVNKVSQIVGEALYSINKAKEFASYINGAKSVDYVREEDEVWGYEPKSWRESSPASMRNAPCACAVAGLPRSPP